MNLYVKFLNLGKNPRTWLCKFCLEGKGKIISTYDNKKLRKNATNVISVSDPSITHEETVNRLRLLFAGLLKALSISP